MNTEVEPNIEEVIGAIAAPPETYLAEAKARLDSLTKPLGSLGRLEDWRRNGSPSARAISPRR